MRTLKALAVMALLAGTAAAHAELLDRVDLNSAVVSGFVSHHINVKKQFNENNYGIGYRDSSGVLVGYYRNSEYRNSVYAVYEASWKLTDNLHIGALAGGVTGYKLAVTPMLLPELALQVGKVELAATYAPKIPGQTPALVALQARVGW